MERFINKKIIKIIMYLIIICICLSSKKIFASNIKLGDVNEDGIISTNDLLMMSRHIVAKANNNHDEWILKDNKFNAADITGNKIVDTNDMLLLLRYIAAYNSQNEIGKKHPEWLELEKEIEATKVIIDKTKAELDLSGTKTATLKATIEPSNATNREITWTSSNTKVATVDKNGKVTAKSNGTAQIIAKTSNGKTCKTTIKVITNPTNIKLNTTSSEIYPNANIKDVKLKITLEPSTVTEKKITWRTSNTKIATVDKNGKVVGKSNGTVNIKATSQNGKVTAICKVKVDTKVLGYTGSKADKLGYIQQSNKGYPIKGGASTHYMWCDNVSLVHSVILLTGNYNITPNSVYKEALKKWRIFKFEYTVEWYISRLL